MAEKQREWTINVASVTREEPAASWDSGLRVTMRVVRDPAFTSFD
jgi:hypothetical protein